MVGAPNQERATPTKSAKGIYIPIQRFIHLNPTENSLPVQPTPVCLSPERTQSLRTEHLARFSIDRLKTRSGSYLYVMTG